MNTGESSYVSLETLMEKKRRVFFSKVSEKKRLTTEHGPS